MSIELISEFTDVQTGHRTAAYAVGMDQSELRIRPFRSTDHDYEAVVAIENANFPDAPFSVGEYRFYDESRDHKYMFERIVAEENGRIVGFASFGQPWWSFAEGKYFFFIHVHPDKHDSSVASALLDWVRAELQPFQPTKLVSDSREDQRYLADLLTERGFEMVMRLPQSELDVQQFDAARFAAVCDSVREAGIRIDSLTVVAAEDSDWKYKMWELEWEIVQDVPAPGPLTRMTFEHWQKRFLESPNFLMDGQTIARDEDRFVGISGLLTSEAAPKKLYTGLTGVIRSHRRRGIATALKVKGIKFAQTKGIELIETDNEENNPMLDLNKQLGYREKPAFVCYEKKLEFIEPVKESLIEPL